MSEAWMAVIIVPIVVIGLPWLIFHYITKWKSQTRLTSEDETMLDDLYELARRLDERMHTLERILHDENPNWNPLASDRTPPRLAQREVEDLETDLRAARSETLDLAKRRRA